MSNENHNRKEKKHIPSSVLFPVVKQLVFGVQAASLDDVVAEMKNALC